MGDNLVVLDRPYGRLAVLSGRDLLAPETSRVLTRMGVDIVAVSARVDHHQAESLWWTRSKDSLHLVVSNGLGREGVYFSNFHVKPDHLAADGKVSATLNLAHSRDKREPPRVTGIERLLEQENAP